MNLSALVQRLLNQGKVAEAANAALEAEGKDPTNIEIKLILGLALSRLGDFDGAKARFESVLALGSCCRTRFSCHCSNVFTV